MIESLATLVETLYGLEENTSGLSLSQFQADRAAQAAVLQAFYSTHPETKEILRRSEFIEMPRYSAPTPAESFCVAIDRPKTAALVCDRVWCLDADMPDGISVFTSTALERQIQQLIYLEAKGFPALTFWDDDSGLNKSALGVWTLLPPRLFLAKLNNEDPVPAQLAQDIGLHLGREVSTVHDSEKRQRQCYEPGQYNVVRCILDGCDIPIESMLSWEQVKEFRADGGAKIKYKRFVHWLDRDMAGKPISYIADEISERYDDYLTTLNKHGIKSSIGTLGTLLDQSTLLSAAIGASAGFLVGGSLSAAFAGGAVAIGKLSLKMADELLEYQYAKRTTNPEIAFVHEIRTLTEKRMGDHAQRPMAQS